MEFNFSNYYEQIVEFNIATEDELNLVTDINGSSIKTLNDVLFARTGYRDWEQYCDSTDTDNVFYEVPGEDEVRADYLCWVSKKLSDWCVDYESTEDDKIDFDTCMENAPDWFDNHSEEFCEEYGYDYDEVSDIIEECYDIVESEISEKITYMYNSRDWVSYPYEYED